MSTPPSVKTAAPEATAVPPTTAAAEAAPRPAVAANAVTRPPAAARSTTRSSAIALAVIAALVIVAAVALPRRPPADAQGTVGTADQSTEAPQERSTDRESTAQLPLAAPAGSPASTAATAAPVTHDVAARQAVGEPLKTTPAKQAKHLVAASTTPVSVPTRAVEPRNNETSGARAADTEPAGTAPAPAPAPLTEITGFAPVTITGCLEISASDDRFRLTDTEGENAPKGRSWRTGFLKKRSASVNLVGVSGALALEKHVGKRVAATGVLASRDLKVSSVRVVSPYCN